MTLSRDLVKRIRDLIKAGETTHAIHKRLGVSRTAVNAYRNPRYETSRVRAPSAALAARRELVAKAAREKLKDGSRKHPTCGAIRAALPAKYRNVTDVTIGRDLVANGFVLRTRPRVVDNSASSNAKRRKFAQEFFDSKINGNIIIFSDEAWVNDNDNTHRKEYVLGEARKNAKPGARRALGKLKAKERPAPQVKMRHAKTRILLWGSIGYNFKGPLVIRQNTVNAERYTTESLPKLLPHLKDKILMHDNAKPHTAKLTKAYLHKKKINVLANWPPYSPHLNPIEKIWATMHKRIAKQRPETVDELIAVAKSVWAGITMTQINNLCRSFTKNLRLTIKNNGEPW